MPTPPRHDPLMIDGKPYYTLINYDPVSIEVTILTVTDREVDELLDQIATQAGGTPESLNDAEWVASKFNGATLKDLHDSLKNEMSQFNRDGAEQQKPVLCASELAKRLCQNVPEKFVEEYRERLEKQFSDELAQSGATLSLFLAQTGMLRTEFDSMMLRQAHDLAEQEAALHAYASAKKIKVDSSELPRLLNVSPEQIDEVLKQAKEEGIYDQLIDSALLNKTVQSVIAEANCSYHFETEAEADARLAGREAPKHAGAAPADDSEDATEGDEPTDEASDDEEPQPRHAK